MIGTTILNEDNKNISEAVKRCNEQIVQAIHRK